MASDRETGEIEIVYQERWNSWVVRWREDWERRGYFLTVNGFWEKYNDLCFRWDKVEFVSKEEAEIAVCKHNLIESGTPGRTWGADDPAPPSERITATVAEKWLRAFAEDNAADYDAMVEGAASGAGYCFGDDDGPDNARTPEFWKRLSKVVGRKFGKRHVADTGFRCAC